MRKEQKNNKKKENEGSQRQPHCEVETTESGASSSSHGIAHVVDYRCHGRTIRPVRSSRQD